MEISSRWWVTWKSDVMPGEEREPARPGDFPDSVRVRTAGPVALHAVARPDPGAVVVSASGSALPYPKGVVPDSATLTLDISPDFTVGRRATPAATPGTASRSEDVTAAVLTLDPGEYMVDVTVTFRDAGGKELLFTAPPKYVTVVPAK